MQIKKIVQVRNLIIGEGMPKICMPITGKTQDEIFRQAEAFAVNGADMAEWRADFFENHINIEYMNIEREEQILLVLNRLREILGGIPLLFTYRTVAEGGNGQLIKEKYQKLNQAVIQSGKADLIDIEYIMGKWICTDLIRDARGKGVRSVLSSHDFEKTPDFDEIVKKMEEMRKLGADIPKMAVMPQNRKDVLTLLAATMEIAEKLDCPVITMSMGGLGAISRIAGGTFGSAVTFACAGQASAPGQMNVEQVKRTLEMLHE